MGTGIGSTEKRKKDEWRQVINRRLRLLVNTSCELITTSRHPGTFQEDAEVYFPKFGFGFGRNSFLEMVKGFQGALEFMDTLRNPWHGEAMHARLDDVHGFPKGEP